jgi:hypothetical protein
MIRSVRVHPYLLTTEYTQFPDNRSHVDNHTRLAFCHVRHHCSAETDNRKHVGIVDGFDTVSCPFGGWAWLINCRFPQSYYHRLPSGPNQVVGHLHNRRFCDAKSPDLVLIGWNMTYRNAGGGIYYTHMVQQVNNEFTKD